MALGDTSALCNVYNWNYLGYLDFNLSAQYCMEGA